MVRKGTYTRIIVLFLLLLPVTAGAVDVEDSAPDFTLKTMDNGEIRYSDIRGRAPLFVVFWATWCPVCKEEIPRLKEIYSKFKPKGLEFIAINVGVNDSVNKVRRYMKKYAIHYPVAFDKGSTVTRLYGVQGTPTIVIIDRRGTVRYRSATIPGDIAEHLDMLMR